VRLASYVSLAGAVLSGIVLIVDLGVPLRFWHMIIQSNSGRLMFKWWSPMSVGVWALLVFGFFALLATLGGLAEEGRLRWRPVHALTVPPLTIVGAIGGIVGGLFLAGYTGVLLSVSNRPLWADSSWLGLLFILSGGSTAIATLILLARWRRAAVKDSLDWLWRFDRVLLVLELVALVLFVTTLGASAQVLVSVWGVVLVLGVALAGIVAPLVLESRKFHPVAWARRSLAPSLVLTGGLLLRFVVLFASEQVQVVGHQVVRP
jgi:formate-dependent nitrite reductase membrane component NrfD